MPKAVISNRIYLNKPPEGFDSIVKALTYKIKGKTAGKGRPAPIETIRQYKLLPRDIISIPIGRADLVPEDYEIIDKRVYMPVPFPNPRIPLREAQEPIVAAVEDSCILNALPGWGKTFAALHIARKLGQKTLVVTHTTMLRDQWITEAEKLYGMKVGKIGSGVFDIEDHAIVVGNVQSITKMTEQLAKEFGTIIIDECHHISATTFTSILESSYARFKIGLSGTLLRKDGKHILFADWFGGVVHKPPASDTLEPVVKLINTGVTLTPGEIWAKKINNLLYDHDYQKFIAALAKVQILKGHKVLIVASRVEFLRNIKEILGEKCVCITGETLLEEREFYSDAINKGQIDAIAGSRQIFSEGISINILSCLILAEPMAGDGSLLEQLAGRIMRMHPDKHLQPTILDLQFAGYADKAQNKARHGFYINKGWEIVGL